MSESSPLLVARGLTCLRGENLLFEALSFTLKSGEALQVEGANGCGKTSLLRILAGLSPPVEGAVFWQGFDIARRRLDYQTDLAYLGHHLGLKLELSVVENLLMAAALRGRTDIGERLSEALHDLHLTHRADLPIRALSAGQRQRVALARMRVSGARLWVLDEPLTALDIGGIAWVVALLQRHLGEGGVAVLTSHQSVDLGPGLHKLVLP